MKFVGIRLSAALLRSRYSISARLRSGASFPFSAILLSICCCVWDYCLIQFWLRFTCRRDDSRMLWNKQEFILGSMARWKGPVAGKRAQVITPSPSCLTVGLSCLSWYTEFGFHQMCHCTQWPNICIVVSSVQRIFVPKTVFLLTNLSKQAYILVKTFPNCTAMNFNKLTETMLFI